MMVLRPSLCGAFQPLLAAMSNGVDPEEASVASEPAFQIHEGTPPTVSIHRASGGFPGIMQGGLVGSIGLGLLTLLSSDRGILTPPFELSVRLLRPIIPGTTVQAADFQAEGHGVSVASLEEVILASTAWKRLETVPDDFSGVLEGTEQADGSFHCLPTCFSAGEENPIGLKRTIFHRQGAEGLARLWVDLDRIHGTDLWPQMVIGDELGWWMGAVLMGNEGVTHAYTYRVRRFPDPGEPLRVVALRPPGKVRRIVTVPVRVVNPMTEEGLAALEVKFIGRQDAASAGMGVRAGELERFREERIGTLKRKV